MRAAAGASLSISTLEDFITDQQQHLEHHEHDAAVVANKDHDHDEKLCRSQSVPATSVARRFSKGKAGSSRRVADSSSLRRRLRLRVVPLLDQAASATAGGEEEQEAEAEAEDIAAEEAVCRICMVALSEEAVLKLECCCKGELALAHRACAIKWFSIEGQRHLRRVQPGGAQPSSHTATPPGPS